MHYRKNWHPIQPKSSQEKNHSKASAISSFSLSVLHFIRHPFSCTRASPSRDLSSKHLQQGGALSISLPAKSSITQDFQAPDAETAIGQAFFMSTHSTRTPTHNDLLSLAISLSLSLYEHLLIAPPKKYTIIISRINKLTRTDGPQPQTNQASLLTLALTWNWSATRRHSARRRSGRGRGREGGERRPPRPAAGAKTTGCWRTPSWC